MGGGTECEATYPEPLGEVAKLEWKRAHTITVIPSQRTGYRVGNCVPCNILVLSFSSLNPKAVLWERCLYRTILYLRKRRHKEVKGLSGHEAGKGRSQGLHPSQTAHPEPVAEKEGVGVAQREWLRCPTGDIRQGFVQAGKCPLPVSVLWLAS